MKKANNTPTEAAIVIAPATVAEIEKLTPGALITVNDDRFTTVPNPKKATFVKFLDNVQKMQVRVQGKFATFTLDKYIGPAKTWQEEQAELKKAAEATEQPKAEPIKEEVKEGTFDDILEFSSSDSHNELVKAEALEHISTTCPMEQDVANEITHGFELQEAAASKQKETVVTVTPIKLNATKGLIVEKLKTIDFGYTDIMIATSIGKALTSIKGNLQSLVSDGLLALQDGFYSLTEYGKNLTLDSAPAKVEKPPKPAKEALPLSAARERTFKMFAMWDEGKTDKEIAEEFNMPMNSVKNIKVTYTKDIYKKTGKKTLFTGSPDSNRARIAGYLDAGKTIEEIKKLVQCDVSYIYCSEQYTLDPEKAK